MRRINEKKRDTGKKLIIALLILAIIFSTVSVIISISVSKLDIPQFRRPFTGRASGSAGDGGIGFVVESSSGGGG